MNNQDTRLAQWAISKVEKDYPEDVCLLIEHRTLKLEIDRGPCTFSYYVPATPRANALGRTFIIEGIGYDLFPITWERLERMADVQEYNTTCLGDAEILYARSETDRERFLSLQDRLKANLRNPHLMKQRANNWLETAVELYGEMLCEHRLYKVREQAGYICDLLALSVALANGHYFPHGQTGQLEVLKTLTNVPERFVELYEQIVRESSPDGQRALCHELINQTRTLLKGGEEGEDPDFPDYEQLAGWYQELIYTWRRVRYFCDLKDPVHAYIWCCMLQEEVSRMGPSHGIMDIDILSAFDPDDLPKLMQRLNTVEAAFVKTIEDHGVKIEKYDSVETFLRQNP